MYNMNYIICAYNIDDEIQNNLMKLGVIPVKLYGLDGFEKFGRFHPLTCHPDMFCFNLEGNKWIFYDEAYKTNKTIDDKCRQLTRKLLTIQIMEQHCADANVEESVGRSKVYKSAQPKKMIFFAKNKYFQFLQKNCYKQCKSGVQKDTKFPDTMKNPIRLSISTSRGFSVLCRCE